LTNWNTENAMLMNIAKMNVGNAPTYAKTVNIYWPGDKTDKYYWGGKKTAYYLDWGNESHTKANTVDYLY